jgi:glycine betaine/proline transport system ATP-binding protein
VQIGTAEEILTDPANDYVARFIQDVDRSRVLTASTIMEPPVALLGAGQGPRAAHRLMRENQLDTLFVVDREKRLRGLVREAAVARALEARVDSIQELLQEGCVPTVSTDTIIADLFSESAGSEVPIAVLDETGRLAGVIPRVTLLAALGNGGPSASELDPEPDPALDESVPTGAEVSA